MAAPTFAISPSAADNVPDSPFLTLPLFPSHLRAEIDGDGSFMLIPDLAAESVLDSKPTEPSGAALQEGGTVEHFVTVSLWETVGEQIYMQRSTDWPPLLPESSPRILSASDPFPDILETKPQHITRPIPTFSPPSDEPSSPPASQRSSPYSSKSTLNVSTSGLLAPPPASFSGRRRHYSADVSPTATTGGLLAPMPFPKMKRYSLVDPGPTPSPNARLTADRRTKSDVGQGASTPLRRRALRMRPIAEVEGDGNGAAGSESSLSSGSRPAKMRYSTVAEMGIQSFAMSKGDKTISKERATNSTEKEETNAAGSESSLSSGARPAKARYSTFTEMGIQSFAMAKGEKTISKERAMDTTEKKETGAAGSQSSLNSGSRPAKARYSTFAEMGIQSFAMAKGDKTVLKDERAMDSTEKEETDAAGSESSLSSGSRPVMKRYSTFAEMGIQSFAMAKGEKTISKERAEKGKRESRLRESLIMSAFSARLKAGA